MDFKSADPACSPAVRHVVGILPQETVYFLFADELLAKATV